MGKNAPKRNLEGRRHHEREERKDGHPVRRFRKGWIPVRFVSFEECRSELLFYGVWK